MTWKWPVLKDTVPKPDDWYAEHDDARGRVNEAAAYRNFDIALPVLKEFLQAAETMGTQALLDLLFSHDPEIPYASAEFFLSLGAVTIVKRELIRRGRSPPQLEFEY